MCVSVCAGVERVKEKVCVSRGTGSSYVAREEELSRSSRSTRLPLQGAWWRQHEAVSAGKEPRPITQIHHSSTVQNNYWGRVESAPPAVLVPLLYEDPGA